MKYRQQFDETDCGAACLAMIASHFGQVLSVAQIRDISGTDTDGTNLKGIIKAASNYGLKATALKGDKNSISEKLPIPFIAHLKIEFDDIHWTYHYVVVKHIGKKKIEIWDPDPLQKKKKISYEEFFKWWTGYAVFFEPDVDFVKSDKKENLLLKFIPVFLPHKKLLFYSLLSSYYSKSMSQNAEVQSYLYESLNGVATVKALNSEEIVNVEYEKKKMTAIETGWTLNRYGISQGLISGLINGISGILVYWIGCSSILDGLMSFGTLITFNSLLGYFTGPLFRLINIQNQVQEALVAAERVKGRGVKLNYNF